MNTEHGVVRLNARRGDLRAGPDREGDLGPELGLPVSDLLVSDLQGLPLGDFHLPVCLFVPLRHGALDFLKFESNRTSNRTGMIGDLEIMKLC